jgi:F0F1-type ATP synthase assembly protein I
VQPVITSVRRQKMNTKEVTAIAFKLLALWLLVQMLFYVPSMITLLATMEIVSQDYVLLQDHLYIVMVGIFLLVGVITAFLLLRTANKILNALPDNQETKENNLSQAFFIQLAGAFFIVSAFTSISGSIMGLIKEEAFNTSRYFYFIGMAFEMTVGIYMLIRPKMVVTSFAKRRGHK